MMKNHRRPFVPKIKVSLPYPWYSETNVTKAGESAYKIRVPFYNNPFEAQPFKSWWIRGFKRAEMNHNAAIRFSMKVQETIALEEVND